MHRSGTALVSLYVINSGFLKASINDNNGHEQITGFFMPGDLVGMEAIATGKHQCNTTALEDKQSLRLRLRESRTAQSRNPLAAA